MITQELLCEAYEHMLTIRMAEELIEQDFIANKIFSFYHSSKGQEAVAVGVAMALQWQDRMYGNHRSHAHYIAKGGDLYRMFAEIYGKADGCCRGYGGSMHMLDKSVGFMGSSPILGSIVPIATGSAFQQKYAAAEAGCDGIPGITVCFFGDGASEEGVVYESINIAAVMKLPILFVIEDNLYAVNTPQSARRSPYFCRRKVYEGLGSTFNECNGNDFASVYRIACAITDSLRDGDGPAVLCARVYRQMAHSGPLSDESVRVEDTKEIRNDADCIMAIETDLTTEWSTPPNRIEEIQLDVQKCVTEAWTAAKQAPEPDESCMMKGIYA